MALWGFFPNKKFPSPLTLFKNLKAFTFRHIPRAQRFNPVAALKLFFMDNPLGCGVGGGVARNSTEKNKFFD